jgi:hypothetical protein
MISTSKNGKVVYAEIGVSRDKKLPNTINLAMHRVPGFKVPFRDDDGKGWASDDVSPA